MLFLDTGTLRISYQSGLQALASCSRNVGNTVFTGLGKQHSYIPCTATLVVVTQHKQFLTIHPHRFSWSVCSCSQKRDQVGWRENILN